MKKFLKNTGFFAIVIFAAWAGLELFYRVAPTNYSEKDKYIKQAYDEAEVVIFGNSHAFYGLNPAVFNKKTFNAANISQTLFYDELLLNKHIDSFTKLKYVILTIEYTSLSQTENHPELQWRKYFYETQMGLDTGLVSPFDIKKYSLAVVPRFRLTINSIQDYLKNGTLAECSKEGFGSLYGVDSLKNNREIAKLVMQKHEDNSLDFDVNSKRLGNIIKKCHAKGIKVILVNMPVTSNYARYANAKKRKLIICECQKLALYDNVRYIDLFLDSRFNDNDFHDPDHLNVQGSKKCSKIIDVFIKD